MAGKHFEPFAGTGGNLQVGPSFTIMNQGTSVLLDGSLTLTRDNPGLVLAKTLAAALESISTRLGNQVPDTRPASVIDVSGFTPFSDEAAALTLVGFTVENHVSHVSLWGTLRLDPDVLSLARASALREMTQRIVAVLESGDLPDAVELQDPDAVSTVKNPFA